MIRAQLVRRALAGAALLALASPALAQGFSAAQKQEMGTIIRDYLMKNPEVLQEAINELQRKTAEAEKTAQTAALKDSGEALLRSPHANVVGNPAGDVTLVEFFDYNCGYCKQALADVQSLVKADPKLRVVLRDLPVLGPDSVEASRVALAVKQQISGDKLFEYHTRLLTTRGRVGADRALALAKEMGLDVARVQKDMTGPAVLEAIDDGRRLAEKLAINGTPAFIIGQEVIPGAVPGNVLKQAIAGVRQCGHAVC